jgi:hypothetical protein
MEIVPIFIRRLGHRGSSSGRRRPGQAWLSAIRHRPSRSASAPLPPAATTLRRRRTELIEQRAQYPRRCRVLINCLGVVQDPRHSERRLSKSGPRLGSQAVGLSRDAQPHGLTQMPQCGTRRSQPDLRRRPPRCGELPEGTRMGHGRRHQRGFGRRRIACAARQRPRAGGRLGGLREGDTKVAAANPADIAPGHPAG